MLHIENLHASVAGKTILRGLDLDIGAREVHAIMGPNGAGKSTLSNVLAGRDGYEISGTVTLDGVDLLGLDPEYRAAAGVFLAFQYPTEIPGVGNMNFLRTSVNALRRANGLDEIATTDFLAQAKQHMTRRTPDRAMLIITHYPRLLDLVRPDHVHVLDGGRITRSGDHSLALELEAVGYGTPTATTSS